VSDAHEALAVADRALAPGSLAWDVFAVRYGTRLTTRGDVYVGADRPDAPLRMDYFFWVLRGEGGTVLVDTGFDAAVGERRGRTTVIDPLAALHELGVTPDDVHEIVLTHLHYDHTGNVRRFPGAKVVVQGRDLAFWSGLPADSEHGGHIERADLEEIDAREESSVLDGHALIASGVAAVLVGGHSPGQTALIVNGRERPVLLASDAVHYYEELERRLPFAIFTDLDEMAAGYDLLEQLVARSGAVLVPGHDPEVCDRFRADRSALRLG
jgi:glyoxylase-like metal-dependent hydrolase (beta-lactamase superfamily II)